MLKTADRIFSPKIARGWRYRIRNDTQLCLEKVL